MDSPAISRSGRVLKKSAKVKEMEDIDIADLESQVKSKKRSKGSDEFEEFDDKRIAPIKIPKISLNVTQPNTYSSSPPKKKLAEGFHSMCKVPPFPSPVKSKFDANHPIFQESSPEGKDGSASSSSETSSSTSSSSSDDESDMEVNPVRQQHITHTKVAAPQNIQHLPTPQEKVIVESYRQFNSPLTFVDQNSELAMFGSEEETSESNLVIAEESNDSRDMVMKEKKGGSAKRKPAKKAMSSKASAALKSRNAKKKPVAKDGKSGTKKKAETGKEKKVTAYMLWCSENRKRIVSQNPVLFSSISKKMGDIWQALPEKEKMAWRRKAKKLAQKGSSIISTGRSTDPLTKPASSPMATEDALRSSLENLKTVGTSPIDVAAYLRLLGESLSIIGQRLTEHEGQIAVSGIFSVLLDSTLCALGPLLCLTAEADELDGCSQSTLSKTLDNIAYFMPGL